MSKSISTCDAETEGFKSGRIPKPLAWGYYCKGETYHEFEGTDCTKLFCEFVIKNSEPGEIIYAHNGGKFDFIYLLPWLSADLKIINGRIAEAQLGNAVLRDSYMILPLPLSAHGKNDIDYAKFEIELWAEHRAEILEYLKSDCIYLHDWVMKFINRFGQRLTLAGTAFHVMKNQFKYDIDRTGERYDMEFRPFYFGGRVQSFQHGKKEGPYIYIDVNSAYSRSMLELHPKGDKYTASKKLPKKAGGWFCELTAYSKGALPLRGENRLEYPVGVGRFKATGWEIYAGLETNTLEIIQIHIVYEHDVYRNFSEYVNFFYNEKLQAELIGDKDTRTFSKLMQNAPYGKMGQDSREFEEFKIRDFGEDEEDDFTWTADLLADGFAGELHSKKTYIPFEQWAKFSQTKRAQYKRPQFYNVATAASITGYQRAFLWRSICETEDVLYCDTDSIVCKKFNGKIGQNLGEWKIEAHILNAWLGGRKFYCLQTTESGADEYKVATKGFSATPLDIINSIENGTAIHWEKPSPSFNVKAGRTATQMLIPTKKGEDARFIKRDIYPDFIDVDLI